MSPAFPPTKSLPLMPLPYRPHTQHGQFPISLRTPTLYVPQSSSSAPASSSSTTWSPSTSSRQQPMPPPVVRTASEIVPRVYVSDLAFAETASCMASLRITHVLSVLPENVSLPPGFSQSSSSRPPYSSSSLSQYPSAAYPQAHARHPPTHLRLPIEDSPFAELAGHLPEATAFIRAALASSPHARVLVHCVEGVSRSPSVVAAYLMSEWRCSAGEAVRWVSSKRRGVNPNFGFLDQLNEYGRERLGLGG